MENLILENRHTVLVVDDTECVRHLITRILQRRNYKVVTAKDGKGAIHIFSGETARIALAIIDMNMPGLSGSETYMNLKTIRHDLPVIFVSGNDIDCKLFASRGKEHNFISMLHKPFSNKSLIREVRGLLNKTQVQPKPLA